MNTYNIKIGSKGYGRKYEAFFRALEIAKNEHKVSVIMTKDKKQFWSVINEICNNSDYDLEVEILKDRFEIFENNILLVEIVERW